MWAKSWNNFNATLKPSYGNRNRNVKEFNEDLKRLIKTGMERSKRSKGKHRKLRKHKWKSWQKRVKLFFEKLEKREKDIFVEKYWPEVNMAPHFCIAISSWYSIELILLVSLILLVLQILFQVDILLNKSCLSCSSYSSYLSYSSYKFYFSYSSYSSHSSYSSYTNLISSWKKDRKIDKKKETV